MSEWQPIDTAEPQDGKSILVATADQPPIVGEAWWRLDGDDLELWWANTSGGDYYADPIIQCNAPVTHWMPLPEPPAESGAGVAVAQQRASALPATDAPLPSPMEGEREAIAMLRECLPRCREDTPHRCERLGGDHPDAERLCCRARALLSRCVVSTGGGGSACADLLGAGPDGPGASDRACQSEGSAS